MVAQFAQNEQNMNAVERVLHYTELDAEGDLTTPNDPPPSWPSEGGIQFEDVELAYREGLPLVLKGISFQIKPGEKVKLTSRSMYTCAVLTSWLLIGRHCWTHRSGEKFIVTGSLPVCFPNLSL